MKKQAQRIGNLVQCIYTNNVEDEKKKEE